MGHVALVIAAWVFLGAAARLGTSPGPGGSPACGRRVGRPPPRCVLEWRSDHVGTAARRMRTHRRVLETAVDDIINRAGDDGADGGTVLADLWPVCHRRVNGRAFRDPQSGARVAARRQRDNGRGAVLGARRGRRASDRGRTASRLRACRRLRRRDTAPRPPAWGLIRTPTRGGVAFPARTDRCACAGQALSASTCVAFSAIRQVWLDPERFDPDRPADATRRTPAASSPLASGPAAASVSTSRWPSWRRSLPRSLDSAMSPSRAPSRRTQASRSDRLADSTAGSSNLSITQTEPADAPIGVIQPAIWGVGIPRGEATGDAVGNGDGQGASATW